MKPESEEDLAQMIRQANAPLRLKGGGTRPIGGPTTGEVVDTSGITGIALYEPGALTMVARAGTPLREVEDTLAQEGQRLAFEPPDYRGLLGTTGTPTIGAVVAANLSGPRRIQVGACRDFMLGVRFVDGEGTIIQNGGRVMKNVTGYDLVKLMTGSWGTLGALTEVSFKVMPKVEAEADLCLTGLSDEVAITALSKALGSPFEVSGAAHIPASGGGDAQTLVRLEGFETSVRYRSGELRRILSEFGDATVELDAETVAKRWNALRDVEPFHGTGNDVWRISVKPSDAPGLVAKMPKGARVIYDWGGGLIWVDCPPGTDLRSSLGAFQGHATLIRADAETAKRLGAFHPEPEPLKKLTAGLKARFDPRGILNPGLMG